MLSVKAAAGVRVPFEGQSHNYIEQEAVEVENSLYYQRRLADGDLVLVEEAKTDDSTNKKGAK